MDFTTNCPPSDNPQPLMPPAVTTAFTDSYAARAENDQRERVNRLLDALIERQPAGRTRTEPKARRIAEGSRLRGRPSGGGRSRRIPIRGLQRSPRFPQT